MEKSNECCSCGRNLDGKEAMRIERGKLQRPRRKRTGPGKFQVKKSWGLLCLPCFVVQVGDTEAIELLAEAV